MSDAKIRQDVWDELEFEPSIDANDIGVAVENGVVTLTGYVPSYPQKLTVEHAVSRIKGVTAIREEIRVAITREPAQPMTRSRSESAAARFITCLRRPIEG